MRIYTCLRTKKIGQSFSFTVNLAESPPHKWSGMNAKKKKQNTAGRGDVEKQASTVKSYGVATIDDPCCLSGDSKFVSMKHETHRSLDFG